LRERFPRLGALLNEVEQDVLTFVTFPKTHWSQIASTHPMER
jgi:putative transposase